MNELIEITYHIHNILSNIIIKYNKGTELTENEDNVLSDIYIAKEKGHLESLNKIEITENKFINHLIMSRLPKNNQDSLPKKEKASQPKSSPYNVDLNQVVKNIKGEPFSTGNKAYIEVAKLIEDQTGKDPLSTLVSIHDYCIKKSNERDLTVKEVIRVAVINGSEEKPSEEQKFENYKLALKIEGIRTPEESSFTDEERIKIKSSVGKAWGTEIMGFIWTIFNFSK